MSILQRLDSVTNGEMMKNFSHHRRIGWNDRRFLFPGIILTKQKGENIHLQDKKYVDDISGDLLNPLFSSFVARDLISPSLKFEVGPYIYVKRPGLFF